MNVYDELFLEICKEPELRTISYNPLNDISALIKDIQNKKDARRKHYEKTSKSLFEHVYRYLDNPSLIDEEIYTLLYTFANKLYTPPKLADPVLGYKIHSTLFEISCKAGDKNRIVREIYHRGLSIFYSSKFIFSNKAKEIFFEGDKYFSEYDSLDKEGKDFLNRALGNYVMANMYYFSDDFNGFDYARKLIDFWEERKNNPIDDLPYEKYIFSTYRNMSMVLQFLRRGKTLSPRDMEYLVKATTYVYDHIDYISNITTLPLYNTCIYSYYSSLWHAGKISSEVLLDELIKLCGENPDDPYSVESVWKGLRMRIYYVRYYRIIHHDDTTETRKKMIEVSNEIKNYLRKLDINKLCSLVDFEVLSCIKGLENFDNTINDEAKLQLLLLIIDYPTQYMINVNYELALSIVNHLFFTENPLTYDLTIGDIKRLLFLCVNSNDAGLKYVETTNYLCSRDYFPEDELIYENHIANSESLIKENGLDSICSEVCNYHHHDFDKREKLDYKTNFLIDIIGIANRLNYLTDDYSLINHDTYNFEDAVKLLNKDKVEFNPLIVEAIKNKEIMNLLKYKTEVNRTKILFDTYQRYHKERDTLVKESVN